MNFTPLRISCWFKLQIFFIDIFEIEFGNTARSLFSFSYSEDECLLEILWIRIL